MVAAPVGADAAVLPVSTHAREDTGENWNNGGTYTMTKPKREQRREKLLHLITADDRTRAAGVELAAELLHVSTHTVTSWLKPEGGRSANPVPLMALELLELKLKAAKKGKR